MFLDAHTHAHFAAYDADRDEVIRRALRNQVWLVNVGTERASSAAAVALTREFPEGVYATVGLHPIHTGKSFHDAQEGAVGEEGEVFDFAYYQRLAEDPKTLAIGECGLDYFRMEGDTEAEKARQKSAFLDQIQLCESVGKPIMIHCRSAFHDLIPILRSERNALPAHPGVIHFFTGTPQDARELLELGFTFTFGGAITFARNYDEAIALIPVDRLLSETDAPYVAPIPHRGKRNEPAYVIEVVKKLAEMKGLSVEAMAKQIMGNARRIFPGFGI